MEEAGLYTAYTVDTVSPAKENGQAKTVRFEVTKERLEGLTVDDLIAMEEAKSTREMRDALSYFVMGPDGEYLPKKEAVKVIGMLTVKQLTDTAATITTQLNEVAAPK